MYVCAIHICSVHGNQVSGPQEVVTAVSHHVSAGN